MIGRKSVLALGLLCALVVSAVSVSSASAAATSYTCVKGGGTLRGAHCLTEGTAAAEYSHVKIEKKTSITGTNANTASETSAAAVAVLAGSLSGVATELQCTTVSGTGSMENKEVSGVMVAHGTGVLTYTGCTVLKPSGKSCVVKNGTVTTNELTAIAEEPKALQFKPASGEAFASITIEKCTVAALNNTFPVTGSLTGTVNGATTTTTEAGVTTQGKLKFGGNAAGLGGSLTLKGENGNGLTLT